MCLSVIYYLEMHNEWGSGKPEMFKIHRIAAPKIFVEFGKIGLFERRVNIPAPNVLYPLLIIIIW